VFLKLSDPMQGNTDKGIHTPLQFSHPPRSQEQIQIAANPIWREQRAQQTQQQANLLHGFSPPLTVP
jgi:hypothetical protein